MQNYSEHSTCDPSKCKMDTSQQGKDQESIQSNTTPDPGHRIGKYPKHKHITCKRVKRPVASSTLRALSSAHCTDVRLNTLRIKIGTNQRALGELSHC